MVIILFTINGLRAALSLGTMALLLLVTAPSVGHAELSPEVTGQVEAAMVPEVEEEAALALRPVLAQNIPLVSEIAVSAVSIRPEYCGSIAYEAASAAPDQVEDIARGIVAVAPFCAGQVIVALALAVPESADQIAAIVAEGVEAAAGPPIQTAGGPTGGAGFPGPNAITPVSSTAENPSQDAASPN